MSWHNFSCQNIWPLQYSAPYKQIRLGLTLISLVKHWLKSSWQWQIPRKWKRSDFLIIMEYKENKKCEKNLWFENLKDLRNLACRWKDNDDNLLMYLRKTCYESVMWLRIAFKGELCEELPCSTKLVKRKFLGQVIWSRKILSAFY